MLVHRWRDRSADVSAAWLEFRERNPALASPYFHPKFAEIVARHCDDVEVAEISKTGVGIDALFVYHRTKNNVAAPLGHSLSDRHGMICAPDFFCDPRELLRQCRLTAFEFALVPTSDRTFASAADGTRPSLQIDLSSGFDSYRKKTRAVKSEQIKVRRIKREIGPLRFTMHDEREAVLETLFRLKEEQYKRTGDRNKFAFPWVVRILRDIYRTREADFAGVLSSLYAGDVLAAAHLGMRSGNLLHHWLPVYSRSLKTYSPGLILLMRMLEHAPAAGIRTLEMTGGTPEYKIRFANAEQSLAYGSVERWSLRYVRKLTRRATRDMIIAAGLEKAARRLYAYHTLWRDASGRSA